MAWQIPILTDDAHAKARIVDIETADMAARMAAGEVADRAGLPGLSPEGRVTTLGRGGSDTSAVALAAALKADRCDIYTDVDGVYTTDPRIVEKARKIDQITYEEMLEMASLGAKVLQTRSVELAMNHHVRVQVLSSFDEALGSDLPGTLVVDEEEIVEELEKSVVSGIAYASDEAKITPDARARPAGRGGGDLRPAGRRQHQRRHDRAERLARRQLDRHHLHRAARDLARAVERWSRPRPTSSSPRSRPTQRRQGLGDRRRHAQPCRRRAKMFEALADKGINIQVISTSEIKISVLIDADYTELAVRALHTAYGLDAA